MFNRIIAALCLCLLAAPAWSQADPSSAMEPLAETDATPEKILVVGQRPGPGLWKISKGDHVLWVFGSYSPLPTNMQWRSQQVESILAGAQEYLAPPSSGTSIGFFKGLTVARHVIGFKKNPDGASLRDVLPADVYARWLPLKDKYIGNDDGIERERPIFAAQTLFSKAMVHAGLSGGKDVEKSIREIIKKNQIKTTFSHIALEMKDPAAAIKEFKRSALNDIACFSMTMERLETDIDAMRVRANAWSKGAIDVIETLDYADSDQACHSAMMSSPAIKGQVGFASAQERMHALWLANAEKALAANASSFAVLAMKQLLGPTSLVAALEAKGYVVEAPQ
jgi:hypothetical protein